MAAVATAADRLAIGSEGPARRTSKGLYDTLQVGAMHTTGKVRMPAAGLAKDAVAHVNVQAVIGQPDTWQQALAFGHSPHRIGQVGRPSRLCAQIGQIAAALCLPGLAADRLGGLLRGRGGNDFQSELGKQLVAPWRYGENLYAGGQAVKLCRPPTSRTAPLRGHQKAGLLQLAKVHTGHVWVQTELLRDVYDGHLSARTLRDMAVDAETGIVREHCARQMLTFHSSPSARREPAARLAYRGCYRSRRTA